MPALKANLKVFSEDQDSWETQLSPCTMYHVSPMPLMSLFSRLIPGACHAHHGARPGAKKSAPKKSTIHCVKMVSSMTTMTCTDKPVLPVLPTEAYINNRTQEQIVEVIPWVHDSSICERVQAADQQMCATS
jgi:hypothetical protein